MSEGHHGQCNAERLLVVEGHTHTDTEACTPSLCSSCRDLPALAMLSLTNNDAVLQKGALPAV